MTEVKFTFKFKNFTEKEHAHSKIEDGCYIYGLYMDGCRYNNNIESLDDSFLG